MCIHVFKIILCSLNRCKLHFDICKQHPLRLDLHSSHMGGGGGGGGRAVGGSMSYVVGSNNSYKPITNTAWVRAQLCKLQKRCTRLAAASDKVYLLLAQGRWFSPGTPASSTTNTFRQNIAEILLKVALNTKIHSFFSYPKRFMCLNKFSRQLVHFRQKIILSDFFYYYIIIVSTMHIFFFAMLDQK